MIRLECPIQHYAWGDTQAIPALLGIEASGEPAAELWMGAHPAAPSLAKGQPLGQLIASDPEAHLGSDVAAEFGALPFLAKVLAAAKPLSIQAHPTLTQAKSGFARENEEGIPLDSPVRVYSDANHKPELVCALTRFEAKCGFRDLERTRELFDELGGDELSPVREMLASRSRPPEVLAATLAWLLELTPEAAGSLVELAQIQSDARRFDEAWFGPDLGWTHKICNHYPGDPGVLVGLLLNHVTLMPGQALFLGAGNLHSYLSGVAIEVMANSNNVIRGGLTAKHIDVPELLTVVDTSPIEVPIQTAGPGSHTFDVPVADFGLTRITLGDSRDVETVGPEIVFATEGAPVLTGANNQQLVVAKGEAVFIPASEHRFRVSGLGVLWRATTGNARSRATG